MSSSTANRKNKMHVLVAGWFSFEQMGTTAGDLIACDIVCGWLDAAGIDYDIAMTGAFKKNDSIKWEESDPNAFTDIIFVCGPFGNGWPVTDFLSHFSGSRLIGINLSLLESLEMWNPFALLFARDSSAGSNPDITFIAPPPQVPVVGIILAHKQKEYGNRALHEHANASIDKLIKSREVSVVIIDTALENNQYGLRTSGEVESLIAKMDMVITTRLHGTVLALKNGVPVIPIDPIAGGAKITSQVKILDWPVLFSIESLDDNKLVGAFEFCLTDVARKKAKECALKAALRVDNIGKEMTEQMLIFQKTEIIL